MKPFSQYRLLFVVLAQLACAPSFDRSVLTMEGPHVVSLSPNIGARVTLVENVAVRFSEPILGETVTEKSVIVGRFPDDNLAAFQGGIATTFAESDSAETLAGVLILSDDGMALTWKPSDFLSAGTYQITLMPTIRSITHRPLNQNGFSGTEPFVSWFVLEGGNGGGTDPSFSEEANNDGDGNSSENPDGEGEVVESEVDSNETDGVQSPSENEQPTPVTDNQPEVEAVPELPERAGLIITEVVTDPQRDWNDTSGGNAAPFDHSPGTGTIGSSDEWIEMENRSAGTISLKEWRLEMIDGSDATEFFSQPASTMKFSLGGKVDSVLPGEFVVLGNPPGDMKNTLLLRLIDDQEEIVDEVDIPDANAEGIFDEAWQWNDDEGWKQDESTLGF